VFEGVLIRISIELKSNPIHKN